MLNEQVWIGRNGFNSLSVGPVAGSSKLFNEILFSVNCKITGLADQLSASIEVLFSMELFNYLEI